MPPTVTVSHFEKPNCVAKQVQFDDTMPEPPKAPGSPYKLDLSSVHSLKSKDMEEEEKNSQVAPRRVPRSKSWRNPSISRKEVKEDEEPVEKKPNRRRNKKGVFGTKREKSQSPGHSYSPRYLQFLHKSPNNSPRDEVNFKPATKKIKK